MAEEERVQFKLMLPIDLKVHLERCAQVNRRSLSAEIVSRLYDNSYKGYSSYKEPAKSPYSRYNNYPTLSLFSEDDLDKKLTKSDINVEKEEIDSYQEERIKQIALEILKIIENREK